MPTLLARGMTFLGRALPAAAGVAIEYARGAVSLDLTAWVGSVDREADEVAGNAGRRNRVGREYLIPAADLTFGPPVSGDLIAETVGGEDETYEVVPADGPLPPWEWSDAGHTVYRVRTVRTATTAPSGVAWGGAILAWGD